MVLRIVLTVVAAKLLEPSFLQTIEGCPLLWIGLQLPSDDGDSEGESKTNSNLMSAVRAMLIADLVMGQHNVIAMAVTCAAVRSSMMRDAMRCDADSQTWLISRRL